jgi:hypothetical protein
MNQDVDLGVSVAAVSIVGVRIARVSQRRCAGGKETPLMTRALTDVPGRKVALVVKSHERREARVTEKTVRK